ncbi:hypothetical protein CTAYLR_005268 [Chrysophaeum taylorii]|uniref:CS domain-containing protein n=1 Tax=Chrysophaeum taylorii TaxID=2483200 RepID=A0AAD7XNC4_9STRA|nr:hypothetical protein CTAYLR_005268 [Chrysophaeum taylorii]
MATQVPPMEWAQRKDSIYLTIKVPDLKNESVDLTATTLAFTGESDERKYGFSFDFFDKAVPEESKWKNHGRNVQMHIVKDDKDKDHWPRLFSDKKIDKQFVTTDWSRYVDEDEEAGDDGFDMSALDGATNFGSGDDDDYEPDSDDDVDLSDLDPGKPAPV